MSSCLLPQESSAIITGLLNKKRGIGPSGGFTLLDDPDFLTSTSLEISGNDYDNNIL